MTTRPYELLARFNNDGTAVSGVHIRRITSVDGRDFEGETIPLAQASNDPAFAAFAVQFAAVAVSERDALKQRVTELEQSLATKTTEAQSLQSQVATLTEQVATLTSGNTELTQQLTAANQRIFELTAALPWNPRVMEAKAFVARITAKEMLLLASSQDAQVQQIVAMMTAWVTNDWPIVLDSPEIQSAVPYLLSVGLVTENRVAELLRDCTREEAYVADGV